MTPTHLADLDELVLRCRDQKARTYIGDAVLSYRAGAIRPAIVSTWIAVCFDLMAKLRELALAGDREAERHIQEIERIRATNDVSLALKFEKALVALARDKFELLSPLECVDLERLQEDRNRCAHPSFTWDEQAYAPSAELARAHIHAAITHLLQHEPAQGKYALDRVLADVDSEYFPRVDLDAAITALGSGPLRNPRAALVRNVCIVLLKRVVTPERDLLQRWREAVALRAIGRLHPETHARTLAEKLSQLFRGLEDNKLYLATDFLAFSPESWEFMDPPLRQRLTAFVAAMPAGGLADLERLVNVEPLRASAKRRIAGMSLDEIENTFFFDTPSDVIDRLLTLYLASGSFDMANRIARILSRHTADLAAAQITRLLETAGSKTQITGSFELPGLLRRIRSANTLPADVFDECARGHDLGSFLPQDVNRVVAGEA